MKSHFNLFLLCISFTALLVNTSCSKDEGINPPQTPQDIWVMAKHEPDLSLFVELTEKLNLHSNLQSANKMSLLAPTNDAINTYLHQNGYVDIDAFVSANSQKAEQLLFYHLIDGKIKADAFTNAYIDSKATNDHGDYINIYTEKKNKGEIFLNGNLYSIVSANHDAGNGYIHKIDGVLEPASLSTLISANSNFSLLMQAAIYADGNFLQEIADPAITTTFFAPDNAAFDALFLELGGMNTINGFSTVYGTQGVEDILNYHSLPLYLKAEKMDSAYYNTNLPASQIYIHKDSNGNIHLSDPFNREIDLMMANITAVNGNMHIISNILLPY